MEIQKAALLLLLSAVVVAAFDGTSVCVNL